MRRSTYNKQELHMFSIHAVSSLLTPGIYRFGTQIIYSLLQTDEGTARVSKFQTISLQEVSSDVEHLPPNPSQSWTSLHGLFLRGHIKTTRKLYPKEIKLLQLHQSHTHLRSCIPSVITLPHAATHSFSHRKFPISLAHLGPESLTEKHFHAWQSQKCKPEVPSSFHTKNLLLQAATCPALHNYHTDPIQFLCLSTLLSASYLHNSSPSRGATCTTQLSAQTFVATGLLWELQQQKI